MKKAAVKETSVKKPREQRYYQVHVGLEDHLTPGLVVSTKLPGRDRQETLVGIRKNIVPWDAAHLGHRKKSGVAERWKSWLTI